MKILTGVMPVIFTYQTYGLPGELNGHLSQVGDSVGLTRVIWGGGRRSEMCA